MLSFHCPSCGATTKFDEKKEIPSYCMFCGSHLPNMDSFVKESLRLKQDEIQLEHDRERHRMEIKTIDKRMARERQYDKASRDDDIRTGILFVLCLIVPIILFFVLLSNVIKH